SGRAGGYKRWSADLSAAPALSCPLDANCEAQSCGFDPACSTSCGECESDERCESGGRCVPSFGLLESCGPWSSRTTTSDFESPDDLGIGVSGALYTVGSFVPGSSFNPERALWKWSADGELIWQRSWDDGGAISISRVLPAPDGGVYVLGNTPFGIDGEPNIGGRDIYLMRFTDRGLRL